MYVMHASDLDQVRAVPTKAHVLLITIATTIILLLYGAALLGPVRSGTWNFQLSTFKTLSMAAQCAITLKRGTITLRGGSAQGTQIQTRVIQVLDFELQP
jgi:hypothetical protein